MTEPGNINQLLPKGQDWIPRKLADLERQIRRLNGGTHNAGGGGGAVVASATFGPLAGVALGDSINMDATPFETHGDWASYFDASSGDVTLLASGLYGFDAYVQGGSGFLTNGGLGVVSFAGYKAPVVVISGQVWGQTHSGPTAQTPGTWSMTTASALNATDGVNANVWCQVYAYSDL